MDKTTTANKKTKQQSIQIQKNRKDIETKPKTVAVAGAITTAAITQEIVDVLSEDDDFE